MQTLHQFRRMESVVSHTNYFANLLEDFMRGWVPGGLMNQSEKLRLYMHKLNFRRHNKSATQNNNSFKPMNLMTLMAIRNIFYLLIVISCLGFALECGEKLHELCKYVLKVCRNWRQNLVHKMQILQTVRNRRTIRR